MSALFSPEWMKELAQLWNGDKHMLEDLGKINFDSTIGFGFIDEPTPRTVLLVRKGKIEQYAPFQGEELEWDLRATASDWKSWLKDGFGLPKLGVATATGKLKFLKGNYRQMVRTPSMARPFLRVFELMSKIKTD